MINEQCSEKRRKQRASSFSCMFLCAHCVNQRRILLHCKKSSPVRSLLLPMEEHDPRQYGEIVVSELESYMHGVAPSPSLFCRRVEPGRDGLHRVPSKMRDCTYSRADLASDVVRKRGSGPSRGTMYRTAAEIGQDSPLLMYHSVSHPGSPVKAYAGSPPASRR